MTLAYAIKTEPVPEPGTLTLFVVSICGAAVYQRGHSYRKKPKPSSKKLVENLKCQMSSITQRTKLACRSLANVDRIAARMRPLRDRESAGASDVACRPPPRISRRCCLKLRWSRLRLYSPQTRQRPGLQRWKKP